MATVAPTMASRQSRSSATTGYEAELWAMADTLRGSMDAAEYKHVVLGLILLKPISDAFKERHRTMGPSNLASMVASGGSHRHHALAVHSDPHADRNRLPERA